MTHRRLAALAFAASLLVAPFSAWPHVAGGGFHGGGGFRGGGTHAGTSFHGAGVQRGGFHGRPVGHGFRGGSVALIVGGGVWAPWYYGGYYDGYYGAYPTPVYSQPLYYCASAGAYYPYVTVCAEPWVMVAP